MDDTEAKVDAEVSDAEGEPTAPLGDAPAAPAADDDADAGEDADEVSAAQALVNAEGAYGATYAAQWGEQPPLTDKQIKALLEG